MWTRKALFQTVIILLRTDYIIVYLNITILCVDDHGIIFHDIIHVCSQNVSLHTQG